MPSLILTEVAAHLIVGSRERAQCQRASILISISARQSHIAQKCCRCYGWEKRWRLQTKGLKMTSTFGRFHNPAFSWKPVNNIKEFPYRTCTKLSIKWCHDISTPLLAGWKLGGHVTGRLQCENDEARRNKSENLPQEMALYLVPLTINPLLSHGHA